MPNGRTCPSLRRHPKPKQTNPIQDGVAVAVRDAVAVGVGVGCGCGVGDCERAGHDFVVRMSHKPFSFSMLALKAVSLSWPGTGRGMGREGPGTDYAWHAFNTRYLAFLAGRHRRCCCCCCCWASPAGCVSLCPKSFVSLCGSVYYRSAMMMIVVVVVVEVDSGLACYFYYIMLQNSNNKGRILFASTNFCPAPGLPCSLSSVLLLPAPAPAPAVHVLSTLAPLALSFMRSPLHDFIMFPGIRSVM